MRSDYPADERLEACLASYFFLGACLDAMACFFCAAATSDLDCFCEDFFWLAFGDLSPM